MASKRRKSSSDDSKVFDDVFRDLGFGGFRDIFDRVFEGRITDTDLMKLLDDGNKARFQKEIEAASPAPPTPSKNEQLEGVSNHGISADRIEQNGLPSPLPRAQSQKKAARSASKGPVFTSVSQITSYLKVDRIVSEIKAVESDWPLFALKESGANCYDFFKVTYPNFPRESRKITFNVVVDPNGILRINTTNSNVNNVEVFGNLEQIFDYKRWGSEKRNQHNMTQGSLGDFLKRILGMGYASWNSAADEENIFQNKQWPEPVILRFNKKEYKVFLIVDEGADGTPNPYPRFEGPLPCDASDYTEVEVALPLKHYLSDLSEQKNLLYRLWQFYKVHTMAPRNIEFSFINEWIGDK